MEMSTLPIRLRELRVGRSSPCPPPPPAGSLFAVPPRHKLGLTLTPPTPSKPKTYIRARSLSVSHVK